MKLLKRIYIRIFVTSLCISTLSGCAGVALTAGGLVASAGVNHTLSGIAYKTFTAPIDQLQSATLEGLEKMDIAVTDMNKTDPGWNIKGTTETRDVEVELEEITSNATRMRVVVSKHEDLFSKDSSTAAEIIVQTAYVMD